jgi:Ca-activated chloride channel family protein
VAAIGVSGVALATPAAQQPIFKSGVDLVPLTVTVTDGSGKFVRGLTGDDFTVYEDGVPQPLSFFASEDVPVDVALVIDTSASMRADLPLVKAAATGLVRALGPSDRGAVVEVSDRAEIAQRFTSDRAQVEQAIHGLKATGSTALYDGLYVVLREFARERRSTPLVRRQILVLLSDGLDNKSRLSFDDVQDAARREAVSVYVIALRGDAAKTPRSSLAVPLLNAEYAMNTVARESGGRIFNPKQATELPAIYTAIAQELASQYELGYMPARPGGDGAYRRVTVQVSDRSKARARTRTGYYAARAAAVLPGSVRE